MKNLLLLFALFPTLACAQKVTIGLNGGAAFFAGMHSDHSFYTRTLKTQVYSGLTAGVMFNKYELVLRLAGNPIEGEYYNFFINNMVFAQNPLQAMLQGNYHKKLAALDLYVGITIGVITYKNPEVTALANLYPTSEFASSAGTGSIAGMQLGCNYPLSRRIDLNFEAEAQYMAIKAENSYLSWSSGLPVFRYHYSLLTFPIMLGVKYKFGKAARKNA